MEKSTKRTYNSSHRQEQARLTRAQIVEAARLLFTERGYSGATMEAIAQQAGVAVETVYAAFGSKRAILSRLIDVSIVGDDQPIPLLQRPGPQTVFKEKDQNRQIEIFAGDIQVIMSRMAPIFGIMRAAARTEPDIAEMLHKILAERVHGMEQFVKSIAANGPLQGGMTINEASETVWAMTSAEIYSLFTVDRGWSGQQYTQWLAKTLSRLILQ